jgi:hypothetical protein
MENQHNIQKIIKNNIFITCILVFVVIYIILNHSDLFNYKFMYTNIFKSILITLLIVLIFYLIFDDDDDTMQANLIENNKQPKYKIMNDGNNQITKLNNRLYNLNKISNDDNRSIFISQQNNKKFGLNL